MKLTNLIKLINEEIKMVAITNIDYSNISEDNFKKGLTGYYSSVKNDIEFTFDAYDINDLVIENVTFKDNDQIPNIINYLNKLT
tara:strand:- start:8178 stop:8429 length:252 start_codon:yes stop_codon:yes gene_type:complete